MTTISIEPRKTANTLSEVPKPSALATTQLANNAPNHQTPFDLDAIPAWVEEEQARLRAQHLERAKPVFVQDGAIRINESAMMYDTVYPVTLSDATYHIIFTSDGAIEIYEVAP